MTKDKKGVTLVSLVVTIIVMIIIFGVTLVSATVILDNSNLTKIQTNLYMAKARAETQLEQYLFDGDIRHLISFSSMIGGNITNSMITPIGYYCKVDTRGNIVDATTDMSCKVIAENEVSKFREEYTFQLKNEQEFFDKIKSIYSNYYEQVEVIKYDINGNPEKVNDEVVKEEKGRFLFVKWGIEECLSQGLYKTNSNGKINDDSIVNENDYIIVVYDLYGGNVSVAYSKGYKSNNKIIYTLDSMLKIDESAEVNE